MDKRALQVVAKMSRAIESSGLTHDTLARATGIPRSTLTSSVERRAEWSVADLLNVGGFFNISTANIFGGTT